MNNKKIIDVPLNKYYYDITMKEFTSEQLLNMGYRVILEENNLKLTGKSAAKSKK